MLLDDFAKHSIVYFATLLFVALGAALKVQPEIISPLAQGLGVALPTMLGAHAVAVGVRTWRGGQSSTETVENPAPEAK